MSGVELTLAFLSGVVMGILLDALATYGVITERHGPQIVPFSADPDEALASLANIEQVEAHWLLPGHGSPWTGGVAAAVVAARDVGIGHLARPKC